MLNTKSIAVLPFVNLSNSEDSEYFSDGITDEIIIALGKIQGLKVIARTSSFVYKNKSVDVRIVGNELSVESILEGSVRQYKERVRILVALVRTDTGSQIWSESFDRNLEDIFALQDEISLLIADKIRENFGHLEIQEHLIEAPTKNIEAYNLYLKARYYQLKWNSKDLLRAIEYYKQSIEQDTKFALPYFGAGLCYGIVASWHFMPYQEGMERADQYLTSGLALNKESYISHLALATIEFWGKWNFRKGEKHLKKAMELNPSFTDAEEGLAELYTAIGDFEKAMHHSQHILEINPLSPNHYYTKGNIEYLTGKYKVAVESMKSALKIDSKFSLAIEVLALCYIQLKDYNSLSDLLKQKELESPTVCRALFKLKYPDENTDFELQELDLLQIHESKLIPWDLYIQLYMGNHSIALKMLEKKIGEKSGQIINFQSEPFLEPLHSNSTFQDLVETVFQPENLPNAENMADSQVEKSLMSEKEADTILENLEKKMQSEKLYRNAALSLRDLAEYLYINSNKLSWLINEKTGKNFNEYLNSYRLKDFQENALNPKNYHLTLLGLAYESGFNSKSVFNSFFKKETGITPRVWVKNHKE